jgi:hypothetical protein
MRHKQRMPSDVGTDVDRDAARAQDGPEDLAEFRLVGSEEGNMLADWNSRPHHQCKALSYQANFPIPRMRAGGASRRTTRPQPGGFPMRQPIQERSWTEVMNGFTRFKR